MSNTDAIKQPSFLNYFASALGILVSLLIFVIILAMGNASDDADPAGAATVKERKKTLSALQAEAQNQADNYAVLDPTQKRVRLPIERAVEVTVKKLNKK